MVDVVQPLPFRTERVAVDRLQLHERATRAYRAATNGLRSAPADVRKSRSPSQVPSALERLFSEVVRIRFLGATIADLRAFSVELDALLDDLERPEAVGRLHALLREATIRELDTHLQSLDVATHATPRVLREFAAAERAHAAVDLEAASEADREARALEGVQ